MRKPHTRRWPPELLSAFERKQRLFRVCEILCITSALLGFALLFIAPAFFQPSADRLQPIEENNQTDPYIFVPIGIISLLGYLSIRFHARKQIATIAVTQILNRRRALYDDRDFFLLLRSHWNGTHQAELVDTVVEGQRFLHVRGDLIYNLASALSPYGSVVVIGGNPFPNYIDDDDPPVLLQNVIWVECPDDSWRGLVNRLSEESRLIIVIPETSKGLRFELDFLRYQQRLDKMLILMAAIGTGIYQQDRVKRWKKIRRKLSRRGFRLPKYDPSGFLYLPNEDLSIKRGQHLGSNEISELRTVIDLLLPSFPSRTPLCKIIKEIESVENDNSGLPA